MPRFLYKAYDRTGTSRKGTIDALNADAARQELAQQGFGSVSVQERSFVFAEFDLISYFRQALPVPAEDLILMTRQFAVMFRAGLPIVRLLQVLKEQTENRRLKNALGNITDMVEQGETLAEAFRYYPRIFSPLYCSMVSAGEKSGALDEVLERLVYILEHEQKLRSEIRSALRYPKLVIFFLIAAFFLFVNVVFPKFETLFVKRDMQLPWPTRICMSISEFFQEHYMLLSLIAVGGILLYMAAKQSEQGKKIRDVMVLRIPLVGKTLIKATMSRFAAIFAILQASGVSLLQTLDILKNTVGNRVIEAEVDHIREMVERGAGVAVPLRNSHYFPPLVTNIVAVGEESGQLEEMLLEITNHYDQEVEAAMKKLVDVIPTVMTVALAMVVGFIALAVYLPLLDMSRSVF